MSTSTDPYRVLSIQSHVVSGYVGNRAATFPLQTLGYDVDVINTVQYSNHTGYGHTNGNKTTPEQLSAIFEGLTTNGLVNHSRILTGYVPGAAALQVVADQVRKMRTANPEIIYVLDPVMGDLGTGLYVSEDVIPVYKGMLELATIITPNQFEVELLSGTTITSLADLYSALQQLHTVNSLPHIAFSSIPLPLALLSSLNLPPPPQSYTRLLPDNNPPWYDSVDAAINADDEILVCFASSCRDGIMDTWAFALPTVRGYFSGVGDLFSAMVLAHFENPEAHPSLPPLPQAVSKALLTVQQILLRTHLYSLMQTGLSGSATPRPLHRPKDPQVDHNHPVIPSDAELDDSMPLNPTDPKRKAKRMRLRELRVVQERELILDGGDGWPGKRLDWTNILRTSRDA